MNRYLKKRYKKMYFNLNIVCTGEKLAVTCNCENDTAKGNPCFILIPPEVIDDEFRVYSFDDRRVVFDEVENTNSSNEREPNEDYWSESVANFVRSEPLSKEQ